MYFRNLREAKNVMLRIFWELTTISVFNTQAAYLFEILSRLIENEIIGLGLVANVNLKCTDQWLFLVRKT